MSTAITLEAEADAIRLDALTRVATALAKHTPQFSTKSTQEQHARLTKFVKSAAYMDILKSPLHATPVKAWVTRTVNNLYHRIQTETRDAMELAHREATAAAAARHETTLREITARHETAIRESTAHQKATAFRKNTVARHMARAFGQWRAVAAALQATSKQMNLRAEEATDAAAAAERASTEAILSEMLVKHVFTATMREKDAALIESRALAVATRTDAALASASLRETTDALRESRADHAAAARATLEVVDALRETDAALAVSIAEISNNAAAHNAELSRVCAEAAESAAALEANCREQVCAATALATAAAEVTAAGQQREVELEHTLCRSAAEASESIAAATAETAEATRRATHCEAQLALAVEHATAACRETAFFKHETALIKHQTATALDELTKTMDDRLSAVHLVSGTHVKDVAVVNRM